MAHHIEQDKAPAESADVDNKALQIVFRQVMPHVHREGNIGARKPVAHRIGLKNFDGRGNRRARGEVHPDGFNPKLAAEIFQYQAGCASHIQNAADR